MDIKEAKKIYKEIPDHQLIVLHQSVFLDGDFTIEQLEAIICILKNESLERLSFYGQTKYTDF